MIIVHKWSLLIACKLENQLQIWRLEILNIKSFQSSFIVLWGWIFCSLLVVCGISQWNDSIPLIPTIFPVLMRSHVLGWHNWRPLGKLRFNWLQGIKERGEGRSIWQSSNKGEKRGVTPFCYSFWIHSVHLADVRHERMKTIDSHWSKY